MTVSQELGRRAEDRAAEYAASLGWEILGRNITNRCGELDIAALDRNGDEHEIVIIEVRCRTLGDVQSPLDSVGPRKLRTLIRASRTFIEDMNWTGFWRIDVIGITANCGLPERKWTLEHIRDITAGMNVFS